MAEKEKAPTYEEYRELVKKRLSVKLSNISELDLDRFMTGEDNTIREWYDRDKAEYDSGGATLLQLTEGSVAGAAYALDLMY